MDLFSLLASVTGQEDLLSVEYALAGRQQPVPGEGLENANCGLAVEAS
jgi:hypothetical protein